MSAWGREGGRKGKREREGEGETDKDTDRQKSTVISVFNKGVIAVYQLY